MSLFSVAETLCPSPLRPFLDRVKTSSIGRRIASGMFWSVMGNAIGKGLTFVAMVLVARLLSKEAFGEFGLVKSTAKTFVTFSAFGMGLTVTKYTAELLQKDKNRVGGVIGLSYLFTLSASLLVAVVFYLVAPWLCETQLQSPHLTIAMKLGAVMLFLTTIMSTQICIMQGFQDFRGLATVSIVDGLMMVPLYVVGAWYGGVLGVMICALTVLGLNITIGSTVIYRNTKRHRIRYSIQQSCKELPTLWQSNLPVFLSGIIYATGLWLSQLMLTSASNGRAELGLYHVVLNYQLIMLFLAQQIQSVFLPMLSELNGREDERQYWHVVKKGAMLNFAVSTTCAVPFIIFPEFFLGLSGAEYMSGWPALVIASLVACITVLPNTCYQILISRGWNWIQAIISCICIMIYLAIVRCFLFVMDGASALLFAYFFFAISYSTIVASVIAADRIFKRRSLP